MKKYSLIITVSLLLHAGINAQRNGAVNIAKGQQFIVENKLSTNSTAEMQGQSMETDIDVTTVYNIDVADATDNIYQMNNKIAAIKLNMTSMGQKMNFDSGKQEDLDGPMGTPIKAFINKSNPVTMKSNGNIIIPYDTSTTTKTVPTETELMMKQLGDPAKEGFGAKMAFRSLPENAKIGTTWMDSTNADGVTKITNFIFQKLEGNNATISFSGTENRDTNIEMQGMEINTNTKGTFSGEEIVDITTGVVIENKLTSAASGIISVMGQDMPTVIKTTSVTTVKQL